MPYSKTNVAEINASFGSIQRIRVSKNDDSKPLKVQFIIHWQRGYYQIHFPLAGEMQYQLSHCIPWLCSDWPFSWENITHTDVDLLIKQSKSRYSLDAPGIC